MGFQDLLNSMDNGKDHTGAASNTAMQTVNTSNTAVIPSAGDRKVLDLSKFSPEEIEKINKLKNEIDLTKSNSVAYFGSDVQAGIAKFADGILDGVKTKDTGVVGQNLTSLLTTIQGVDVEKLQEKESFISKIPLLGKLAGSVANVKVKLQDVTETVDRIVVALDTARKELIRDVNVLDTLYEKNVEYLEQLDIYIAAGESRHKELSETVLIELRNKAQQTQDMLDIQKYNDFAHALNEIEKRIYDLKLSREIAIQTMPQIRIIQNNDKVLASKIQSSILTTIPIWKNQIALAISLHKQKTALELQKKVTDTTENMLRQNAELLKMNSIEIARESERGIISFETLKDTHTKLLETIEESMKIYQEGHQKRLQIEGELAQLEANQKQKLLAMRSGGKV
ncbi:MAG: toxic anion resistance protein [Clostridia bacterium]|nr:toxic anion resistance protein [Clostridia bacterium]